MKYLGLYSIVSIVIYIWYLWRFSIPTIATSTWILNLVHVVAFSATIKSVTCDQILTIHSAVSLAAMTENMVEWKRIPWSMRFISEFPQSIREIDKYLINLSHPQHIFNLTMCRCWPALAHHPAVTSNLLSNTCVNSCDVRSMEWPVLIPDSTLLTVKSATNTDNSTFWKYVCVVGSSALFFWG